MLGLAATLPANFKSVFASFREEGLCRDFLTQAHQSGFGAVELKYDTPQWFAAWREIVQLLKCSKADILCCHGYKAGLLGLLAGRRLGLSVVAVSRGWTAESVRVRIYEALDRAVLRWMDRVVCVSKQQARRVRQAGVSRQKATVIENAVQTQRFAQRQDAYGDDLRRLFPEPRQKIVGAAGRLSPEKGFDVLVHAAAKVVSADRGVGFVLFGEGLLRDALARQIESCGLQSHFVLAGFRSDFDQYLPHLDLMALPSFTEGLPNVLLESFAAGVPVVATAVGGTPEVVEDGVNGCLVAPGDPAALARRITGILSDDTGRKEMSARGRQHVRKQSTFFQQAGQYCRLFSQLRVEPSK